MQGPKRLPVITYQGRRYFVDVRLGEFRSNVYTPEAIEFVRFGSAKGQRMLAELHGRGLWVGEL